MHDEDIFLVSIGHGLQGSAYVIGWNWKKSIHDFMIWDEKERSSSSHDNNWECYDILF